MYSIVADSCCDMNPELQEKLGIVSVPLTLTLGDKYYIDDASLDLPEFMKAMKSHSGKIGSAAPSPGLYCDAFTSQSPSFGITLSSQLSGSYQSAVTGAELAAENGAETYVFDSKSASAGEILVAIELKQLIEKGVERSEIISKIEQFIKKMKTYFVLDSVDNLRKNGRLNFIVGKIISVLGLKPLMGSDGNGNIALFSHARGVDKTLQMMANTVVDSGIDTKGRNMVITHSNNPDIALRLKELIKQKFNFANVWVFPTRGLSSVYADDKGIIMAY